MKNKKIFPLSVGVLVLSLFVGYLAYAIIGWTEPTQEPPLGNVDAPLNVGPSWQAKEGGLILNTGYHWLYGFIVKHGRVGIGTTTPAHELDVIGNIITMAYFHHSDKALKTEITPLENSLAKILDIEPISFRWKKNNEIAFGFIAQDIENIFPEIVNTNKETGLKSVNYSALIAPLVQAISEQQKQINHQQVQINELKDLIKGLK